MAKGECRAKGTKENRLFQILKFISTKTFVKLKVNCTMRKMNKIAGLYGALGICAGVAIILAYIFHKFWLRDLAGILLGLTLEALIIPLSALALRNQKKSISGQRLLWARALLIIIVFSAICFVFYYFQYWAVKDIQLHF